MTLSSKQCKQINEFLPSLTPDQWQVLFRFLKASTERSGGLKFHSPYSFEKSNTYSGESDWYRYTQFINNILDSIRAGEEDYCFKIEHVIDLLRFEPIDLMVDWLPNDFCFKVYKENNL